MKKFLSLVLALIMTMSLVTISAGATEYRDLTDKDEIQYEEAVAVLNRIGVITGYEDGSFRPEGELTRGAAAKIIVSLLIGPEAASNLPNATAPYPDVPASHTFAGVISYCKTAKIISGYGDGTFKPGNSLTGFAFAKMLLGALGYKQEIEGFVDTGWTMNVAKVGNVTGLFDRLDFDGAAAVNRETACQLALNTLKATMVTYGGTTMVSGAQTLAVQGTQAMYVTSNNREINANINRRVINAVNNEMTLEFGEEHFKDLRLEHDKYDPAYDIYGHPSNEWSYKKVTIGTFKLPADFTYTKQMAHIEDSVATKEKALGLRNYDTYSLDHRNFTANWSTASSRNDWNSPFADATQVTINGWNARAYNSAYVNATTASLNNGTLYTYDADSLNTLGSVIDTTKKAQAPSLAEICDLTDNGVTVEVYVCPVDADFITNVVVTRTQLMKVKTIGSDFVRLDSITPDSHDHYKEADVKNSGLGRIAGYNAFAIDCTCKKWSDRAINDVKDDNYDAYNALKDMKAGDYVAVVPYTADDGKTWEVGEAYAPETVSGRLTRVDIYNSEKRREGNAIAITVGGTSYPINEWNKDMRDITDNIIKSTRKDVTVYLAKDGTALWATKVGNTDAWMVVGDYYQGTNDAGKIVWYVHGWTLGGDEVDLDLGTIRGAAEKYAPGELVRYEINTASGGGEYILGKPNYNGSSVKKAGMYDFGKNKFVEPIDALNPATADFDEDQIKEYARADSSEAWEKQCEGIYRVALAYGDDGEGAARPYTVDKGLDYIALDYYGYNKADPTKNYVANNESVVDSAAPTVGYKWMVSTRYYDTNPTFIYVSFDSAGEVGAIDFVKGRQDVRNEDLRDYNTAWRNVGTNNDDFVATTAEAYVNDSSKVEAVVIKTDSSDANLSSMRIITKGGSNNHDKSNGSEEATTSFTGKWNEREYVQGPDFNMSDAKVGVFDKGYDVGDILVGTEKDGIFYAKEFHGDIYRGNSLDGLWIKGIARIEKDSTPYLEDCFKINGTVKTLDQSKPAADFPEYADLMKAEDEPDLNTDLTPGKEPGLIRCVNAKIVDVRVGHEGEITKLKDLLDTKKYNLDEVEIKVLFNGKKSDASFRNAYAVVILDAPKALKSEIDPKFSIDVDGDDVTFKDGKYQLPVLKKATLTATLDNASELNLGGVTYEWKITSDNAAKATLSNAKSAQATFKAEEADTYTVQVTVTNPKVTLDTYGQSTKTITIVVGDKEAGAITGTIPTKVGTIEWTATTVGDKSMVSLTLTKVPAFVSEANGTTVTGVLEYALKGGEIPGKLEDLTSPPSPIGTANKITFTKSASGWSTETVVSTLPLNNTTMRLMEASASAGKFVASAVKAKIEDKAGNAVTLAGTVTHKTDIAVTGTALNFELPLQINAGQITVDSISGGTLEANGATVTSGDVQSNGSVLNNSNAVSAKAAGNDYVTLTLGTALTSLTRMFTVTGLDATNITVGDSNTTVAVAPDAGTTAGSPVRLTATLSTAVPFAADPVEITVGGYKFVFPNDNTTKTATVTTDTVTADIDLSAATPVVAAIANATPTAKSATLTDATAGAIAASSFINVELSKTVTVNGTPVISVNPSVAVNGWTTTIDSDGSLKIAFATTNPAKGATVSIPAGSVKTTDGYCNKTAITVTLNRDTTANNVPMSVDVANG